MTSVIIVYNSVKIVNGFADERLHRKWNRWRQMENHGAPAELEVLRYSSSAERKEIGGREELERGVLRIYGARG